MICKKPAPPNTTDRQRSTEIKTGKGITRRKLLRYGFEAGAMAALVGAFSFLPTEKNYLRPPGAAVEAAFHKKCIKCGACIEACPTGALDQLDLSFDLKNLGTPVFNFQHGGCIAWHQDCFKCVEACPTDALTMPPSVNTLKLAIAEIRQKPCVNCMMCFLKCPVEGAILFPNPNGEPFSKQADIPAKLKSVHSPLKPYIVPEKCVGCGLCAHYCPVKVVDMHPVAKEAAS